MISSKGDRLNLRMLVRLSRKADKTQIFSHKDSSCCREEAFLVDEEQLAGKLDCFPHLPQIPESCSGSPHHPGAGSFSWCRILPPPPGASLHAHHHQLLVATTRLCTTFLPPPAAAGACQTCTTTKKLARLAPGPAYHSQLSFLRDSPHLLQHRLT